MDELVTWEYFGFHPNQLYHEIYAVGYNEFLSAVSLLRDTLLEEFPEPERQREIQQGCDQLLSSYSNNLDHKWFQKFIAFCSRNVFTVSHQVPVYGDLERVREGGGRREEEGELHMSAAGALDKLHHTTVAVEYLNCKLQKRLEEVEKELGKRRELLRRVRMEVGRLEMVEAAQKLEQELRRKEKELQDAEAES